MNTKTLLAIFVIATSIAVASLSIATPASAAGDKGLAKADLNIHDNTGFASPQDIAHHEGTCQGGHPVAILDGCNNAIITDPGSSDTHRQNP